MVAELALDRVNGWERSKEVVVEHFPRLASLAVIPTAAPITHPVHVEVMAAWASLPASVKAADGVLSPLASPSPNTAPPPSTDDKAAVENPRRKLTKAFSQHQRDTVRSSLDPLGKALFDAAATKGAREWVDATPRPGVPVLNHTQTRVALSLWLGARIPELANERDPLGRARMRGDAAGRNHRHSGLVSALGDLMVESGHRVYTEVVGIYGPFPAGMSAAARRDVARGELRRMDLVGVTASLAARCVDPTLIDAHSPTLLRRGPRALCPLAEAEEAKAAHYVDTPDPFTFSPFAAGTLTELGPSASACLEELAQLIARRRNGGQEPSMRLLASVRRYVRVKVGRAIMKHLAWQICSSFLNSPAAALSPARRYRHSASRRADEEAPTCTCGAARSQGSPQRECYCSSGLR